MGPCCQYMYRQGLKNILTLEQYLDSPQLKKIKDDLNDGLKITNCKFCWNQEDSKILSMRQKNQDLDISKIREIFITFGNQCNTACRICNSSRSSLIAKYNKEHKDTVEYSPLKVLLSTEHEWDRGRTWYKDLAKDVADILDDLELIQISGGEPFINVHFDNFIGTLIDTGKKLPVLRITTNGSFNEAQIEKLKNFKKVEILLSVDGMNKDFYEFLRWPLKYDDLVNRIEILKNVTHDNISVDFQLVMHNLNLTHIHDAIVCFQENFKSNPRFSMTFTALNGATWYSLYNSPKKLREIELEKIKSLDWDKKIKPKKEEIIQYLSNDFKFNNLNMLINHVKYTDSYRNFDTWNFLGWHPSDL